MKRSLAILLAVGLLLLGSLGSAGVTTAATLASTTTCSNGVDNTGGLGLICQVTIVNRITKSGGSAKVTVRECHGAAGAPNASCSTNVSDLNKPVTHVTQCNDSINGGGGTLRCSVKVTNNFVALASGKSAATINECVGSGGGIHTGCDPYPATTSGAAITQCNGSANGGTLVGLTCTATGTKSSNHHVTINQCNGSANGGGALVICTANISNHVIAASSGSSGSTSRSTTSGTGSGPTPPATDTASTPALPGSASGATPLAFVALFLLSLVVVAGRRSHRAFGKR